MLIVRILAVLALVLCSCAGPKSAKEGASKADVMTLVEAERSFARFAEASGTRAAFLEFLTDEAVIFRPRPVNAHDWYTENTQDSGLLSWEPVYAEISSSGELGYTTGPWEFRRYAEDAEAASYGHYVSIWRKQADGSWRVILDLGNVYDRPVTEAQKLETRVTAGGLGPVDPAKEREVLLATESVFSDESAKGGLIPSYMAYTTEDIRFYRVGAPPVKGQTPTRNALKGIHGVLTWKALDAGVSAAGDLGYTYGTMEYRDKDSGELIDTSSYMRIWRIESGGRWSVALDIVLPAGPAQPIEE
jgi:ketosteroid isomerase-like protein